MEENNPKSINSSLSWYKDLNKDHWRVLFASGLGWMLDAFDYSIFAFTIYTFIKLWGITTAETGLVVTCTLIASALGGILFGILSDKYGRVKIMSLTIILYAAATGLIAFSQSIWQVLILRTIAAMGLGGEWTAGATLISETWPEKHRGKGIAIMQGGYSIGLLIAAFISGYVISTWGWQVLYVIGALPAILSVYIRRTIKEPQVWLDSKSIQKDEEAGEKRGSIINAIFEKGIIEKIILGLMFIGLYFTSGYSANSFLPAYLATPVSAGGLGQSTTLSSLLLVPNTLGALFGFLTFGFLSDKIGRKKTFLLYIVIAILTGPGQILAAKYSINTYICISILNGFFGTGMVAGFGALLSELFPTRIRATATGFCYNGGKIISALSVMMSGILIPVYGYFNILFFVPFIAIPALICLIFIKDRTGIRFEA